MTSQGTRNELAPIALFAYRRPNHLAKTLAALRANPEARNSILYVFSDAAKEVSSEEGVQQVRALLPLVKGFAKIELVLHSCNLGLSRNITEGVSAVLNRHDAVIVVEDDLVVSPFFLRYMNAALACYQDEDRVGSISGFSYPVAAPETFFIRGADCWGWATWRDRWHHYNPDGSKLLAQLNERGLADAFDLEGAMAYTQMLEDQVAGRNDSWAVRWHASCFLRDLLILYPGRTLVQNVGNDGSGIHATTVDDSFTSDLSPEPVMLQRIPIAENVIARQAIRQFFLLRHLRQENARLLEEIGHLNTRMAEEVARRTTEADQLRGANTQLSGKVMAIERSFSWRLTSPLRRLLGLMR